MNHTLRSLAAAALLLATASAQSLLGERFPIGVWLQAPGNAQRYRELGIELYVGLYQGPTRAQLEALAAAGMPVLCAQNEVGLAHAGPTILGWMHGDEPDNAQGRRLTGYRPPVPPWQVVERYEAMHRKDPTRPVLLNLGQGAAWDGWHGRGERSGRTEDYPEYLKGCDIASFDIYPATHPHADVHGRLEFVGRGVQRLRGWSGSKKPVWAVLETARVAAGDARPTPEQVHSAAWIAICCGASGIVWFAHEFEPVFVEAGMLQYPEITTAVRTTNAEVQAHAAALRSEAVADAVTVTTEPPGELAVRVHRHDGALHVFAASLQPAPLRATLRVRGRDEPLHGDFAPYGFRHWRVSE